MTTRDTTLTGSSKITVGILGGILVCAFYAGVVVTRIDNRMGSLEESVKTSWTVADQKLFVSEMRSGNPATPLNYPDPDSIKGRK